MQGNRDVIKHYMKLPEPPVSKPAPDAPPARHDLAERLGDAAYRHRDAMNGPFGWFTVKQVTASFVASFNMMLTAIPTAFGLDLLHSKAKRDVAAGTVGRIGKLWADPQLYKPLRAIAFVASGFTMYRGTRKILNKLYDEVFDPANSEAQTVGAVRHLPQEIKDAVADVMPAEAQSTPFGAIALGGIRSLYQAPADASRIAGKEGSSFGRAVLHPESRFVPQVVIDTLGYSAFFELSDRLFKDVELRRGRWKNEPNSIASIKHSAMDAHAPAGDDDPSLKRLVFRRVLPTAMGITAYTVTHRVSKMLTGAPAAPEIGESALTLLQKFAHSFGAEFAGIGTFFVHSALAEKYEKAYDYLLGRIEEKHRPQGAAIG